MLFISSVGAKSQITLPKDVRKLLGIKEKNDMVGFIVEDDKIVLTRIEPVVSSSPFGQEEWKKIKSLASKKPEASFNSSKESIEHLRKKLKI